LARDQRQGRGGAGCVLWRISTSGDGPEGGGVSLLSLGWMTLKRPVATLALTLLPGRDWSDEPLEGETDPR